MSYPHHPVYYIRNADTIFLVEEQLFRAHRYFLERDSVKFRDLLRKPASPGQLPRGSSDSLPLRLEGMTAKDFDLVLWVFYHPQYNLYDAPLPDWIRLLEICYLWEFFELKELAIREIQKHSIDPVEKIVLYHTYEISEDLLVPSYVALCMREEALTLDEGRALGMETSIILFAAREGTRGLSGHGPSHLEIGDVEEIIRDILEVRESLALGESAAPTSEADPVTFGDLPEEQVDGAEGDAEVYIDDTTEQEVTDGGSASDENEANDDSGADSPLDTIVVRLDIDKDGDDEPLSAGIDTSAPDVSSVGEPDSASEDDQHVDEPADGPAAQLDQDRPLGDVRAERDHSCAGNAEGGPTEGGSGAGASGVDGTAGTGENTTADGHQNDDTLRNIEGRDTETTHSDGSGVGAESPANELHGDAALGSDLSGEKNHGVQSIDVAPTSNIGETSSQGLGAANPLAEADASGSGSQGGTSDGDKGKQNAVLPKDDNPNHPVKEAEGVGGGNPPALVIDVQQGSVADTQVFIRLDDEDDSEEEFFDSPDEPFPPGNTAASSHVSS